MARPPRVHEVAIDWTCRRPRPRLPDEHGPEGTSNRCIGTGSANVCSVGAQSNTCSLEATNAWQQGGTNVCNAASSNGCSGILDVNTMTCDPAAANGCVVGGNACTSFASNTFVGTAPGGGDPLGLEVL